MLLESMGTQYSNEFESLLKRHCKTGEKLVLNLINSKSVNIAKTDVHQIGKIVLISKAMAKILTLHCWLECKNAPEMVGEK